MRIEECVGEEDKKEEIQWVQKSLEWWMYSLITVRISWVYSYVKAYQIVHFKYEQYIVCQLIPPTNLFLETNGPQNAQNHKMNLNKF